MSKGGGDQPRSELKKQLRQEFSSILGNDDDAESEPRTPIIIPEKNFNSLKEATLAESVEMDEGALQNKIKQKQNAFAELKKEALNLLIDL